MQYTATAQANLLISLVVEMSPDRVVVLDPGTGYTGGQTFFPPGPLNTLSYVHTIPTSDCFDAENIPVEPPESLKDALAHFYVGAVFGRLMDNAEGNRSMMIHPDRLTSSHQDYVRWSRQLQQDWSDVLSLVGPHANRPPSESEEGMAYDRFYRAYQSLCATHPACAVLG